jgi:hypothetical protein
LLAKLVTRAGPGVSPASPWARATPHPGATKMEKKKIYTIHIKKKIIYTYTSEEKKKKFIRGQKNIFRKYWVKIKK